MRRYALRDPRLLADYARLSLSSRHSPHDERDRADGRASAGALPVEAALERVRNEWGDFEEGPALAHVRAYEPEATASATGAARADQHAAGAGLAALAYAVVRAQRPERVIETGVATGVTSAHVLAALADNGAGELHSIDLPPPEFLDTPLAGGAVPPELRAGWRLRHGSSRRLLPGVLRETAGVRRLFIHDSDHRYEPMRWELEQALAAFGPGDAVLADDVDGNDAFADVARAAGLGPVYVDAGGGAGTAGMLVLGGAFP